MTFAARRGIDRGFTLIEMLVLIIIISIISAVAVPAYARFLAQTHFQNTVQNTVSLLSWAREAAIQAGSDSVVRFDAQTESFMVSVDTPAAATDVPTAFQETQESVPPATSRGYKLGEDTAVSSFMVYDSADGTNNMTPGSTGSELRFHEDGSSNGGRLVMISMDGFGSAVEVSSVTGRVTITDANGNGP